MKNRPIQHSIEFAGYRGLRRLLQRRDLAGARVFGKKLGRFGHRVLGRQRKVALGNVQRAFPELTESECQKIVEGCFQHHGSHFSEQICSERFEPDAVMAHFELEGLEVLEQLKDRGFFIQLSHFGSWEMALYPLATQLEDVWAVFRPPDNPKIDAEVRRQRARCGVRLIEKSGASHRMLNACRKGGRVAVIIDQHVRPSAGIQVPFFGHLAWTSPILAMLSLRTGAPVVTLSVVPEGRDRYRMTVQPAIWPGEKGPDAVAELTRRYLEAVENDIRQRPELWLWMHRRWR